MNTEINSKRKKKNAAKQSMSKSARKNCRDSKKQRSKKFSKVQAIASYLQYQETDCLESINKKNKIKNNHPYFLIGIFLIMKAMKTMNKMALIKREWALVEIEIRH